MDERRQRKAEGQRRFRQNAPTEEQGNRHESAASRQSHGRYAMKPTEIPPRGWKDVLARVWTEIGKDNVSLVAGGIAFYGFLAIFPALGAIVMLFGVFADPQQVAAQMDMLRSFMPQTAWSIINDELTKVVQTSGQALSFGALASLLFAIWSATKGTNALMMAMNIAYEQQETRGFIRQNLTSLLLTAALVVFVVLAIAAVVVVPTVLHFLPLGPLAGISLRVVRWVVMAGLIIGVLALIYRYGPARREAKLKWVSAGAVTATVLWLLGSILFSFYVAHFASYNKTFGSLGAVVALQMWFWLSAYVICVGAELNAELERQTARDSGVGDERPMGTREATVADQAAAPD